MMWFAPIGNAQKRQKLKRHLQFWLLVYVTLTVSLSVPYILSATQTHSLAPLSQLSQLVLVYVPYQVTFVNLGLYWVLPPLLIKQHHLFIRRFLIYLASGLIIHFLIRIFVLLPLRSGQSPLYLNFHSLFSLGAFLTMLLITGVAVGTKIFRFWYQRNQANQQLVRQTLSIELQVLKAQIHPHFLFNTLNNLYSLTLKQSPKAADMALKLARMLHYMIHECSAQRMPLGREIEFIKDYIELENLRYGQRLKVSIHVSGEISTAVIAPLLLIPFVENAFKHGPAKQIDSASINLVLMVKNNTLIFKIENSRSEIYDIAPKEGEGLGLINVRKRLALIYPNLHELNIHDDTSLFTIELSITLGHELKPNELLYPVLQTES